MRASRVCSLLCASGRWRVGRSLRLFVAVESRRRCAHARQRRTRADHTTPWTSASSPLPSSLVALIVRLTSAMSASLLHFCRCPATRRGGKHTLGEVGGASIMFAALDYPSRASRRATPIKIGRQSSVSNKCNAASRMYVSCETSSAQVMPMRARLAETWRLLGCSVRERVSLRISSLARSPSRRVKGSLSVGSCSIRDVGLVSSCPPSDLPFL